MIAPLILARQRLDRIRAALNATVLRCRHCGGVATCGIRSGLEWHPTCDDCAEWWSPSRRGELSEVDPEYEYEYA